MFTSHFANIKNIPSHLRPVAIAIGVPAWYKGERDLRLAPTRAMLKMTSTEYDKLFAKILDKVDPKQIADELGDNAVLLCWEKPGERCHRRWVAEFLEEALGVEVPELGFPRDGYPAYADMPSKLRA
jgi:hypothetical protein